MVLLAAAICTKTGKALVSRQFVEMTRARIEGLLVAFPKLIGTDKSSARQHTFVETESVRYVYQPLDQLYMLLITTKNSNILEDLETLRLFSRVIPEYCRSMEEKEVLENSFQIIFAFDEIVALGYRESVNLAQIRTFTEMDSHEERVFYQIKKTQEEEAKKLARDKAKELTKAKLDIGKHGGRVGGGIGSSDMKYSQPSAVTAAMVSDIPKMSYQQPDRRPAGPNKALKLGAKKADEDQFVKQLKSEGQDVAHAPAPTAAASAAGGASSRTVSAAPPKSNVKMESVHLRCEEKLTLVMSRDGGVQQMEVHGLLVLRIADAKYAGTQIHMRNNDTRQAQIQTHPNLDKKSWQSSSILALKNADKPFPLNNDIGVLKWRVQTTDESAVPLTINCWPSETSNGCEVNIEYTLEDAELTLNDVVVTIPLPSGCAPVIGACDGEYKHERSRAQLVWTLPPVNAAARTGTIEFTTPSGHADNFFPVRVHFTSQQQFSNIKPEKAVTPTGEPVVFSQESTFYTEKFEIV